MGSLEHPYHCCEVSHPNCLPCFWLSPPAGSVLTATSSAPGCLQYTSDCISWGCLTPLEAGFDQDRSSLMLLAFFCTFSSVQLVSCVRLFATPWTTSCQASLSINNSWSLLKLMSIESVMTSNHLILYHPLLLQLSIFPSIRVFSNESVQLRGKAPVLFAPWNSAQHPLPAQPSVQRVSSSIFLSRIFGHVKCLTSAVWGCSRGQASSSLDCPTEALFVRLEERGRQFPPDPWG